MQKPAEPDSSGIPPYGRRAAKPHGRPGHGGGNPDIVITSYSIHYTKLYEEYDITIRVSDASANKMLNRQEKVEIFKSQAENPIVNIERLTSDFLESYDIRNVEEYRNNFV